MMSDSQRRLKLLDRRKEVNCEIKFGARLSEIAVLGTSGRVKTHSVAQSEKKKSSPTPPHPSHSPFPHHELLVLRIPS